MLMACDVEEFTAKNTPKPKAARESPARKDRVRVEIRPYFLISEYR